MALVAQVSFAQTTVLNLSAVHSSDGTTTTLTISISDADLAIVNTAYCSTYGYPATVTCTQALVDAGVSCALGTTISNPQTCGQYTLEKVLEQVQSIIHLHDRELAVEQVETTPPYKIEGTLTEQEK
jgi:hypothetical protein